jgi:hypothetical protein
MGFTPQDYGDAIGDLIDRADLPPLGPGSPYANDEAARDRLASTDPETLFADRSVADSTMATCCLSALLLLHNDLDGSHTLSQSVKTAEGSFWHGIMHRREPDFPNAKYWFNRLGQHPVFEQLQDAVSAAGSCEGAETELAELRRCWDPYLFIDLCEHATRGGSPELSRVCRTIAQAEWRLLFDYCFRLGFDSVD